ncbi:flagellar basal body L-ring protein FlgH [bacterium]|nr:flagellar basal body L-ring protein FlgH [bacterium]
MDSLRNKTILLAILCWAALSGAARADSLLSVDNESDASKQGLYATHLPSVEVGEVIKVRIREKSTATVDLSVSTKDQSKQDVSLNKDGGLFGKLLGKALDLFSPGGISSDNKGEFKDSGSTDRSMRMDAVVTAMVVERLSSGMLVIEGRKNVKINAETQTVVVRGVIDPRDLDQERMIDSDLVADAEIEYVGAGQLSKKSKPGFLSRVLDVLF